MRQTCLISGVDFHLDVDINQTHRHWPGNLSFLRCPLVVWFKKSPLYSICGSKASIFLATESRVQSSDQVYLCVQKVRETGFCLVKLEVFYIVFVLGLISHLFLEWKQFYKERQAVLAHALLPHLFSQFKTLFTFSFLFCAGFFWFSIFDGPSSTITYIVKCISGTVVCNSVG